MGYTKIFKSIWFWMLFAILFILNTMVMTNSGISLDVAMVGAAVSSILWTWFITSIIWLFYKLLTKISRKG